MKTDKDSYLHGIFDNIEKELTTDSNLVALFALMHDEIVGFTFFGPLEESGAVLVRTLPVDLSYKYRELEIRNKEGV